MLKLIHGAARGNMEGVRIICLKGICEYTFLFEGPITIEIIPFSPFFLFQNRRTTRFILKIHRREKVKTGEKKRGGKGHEGRRREEEAKSVKERNVIIPLNRDRIRVHSACYYAPGRCLGDVEWKQAGRQLPPRLLPLFSPCSWTVDNESDVAETNATNKISH